MSDQLFNSTGEILAPNEQIEPVVHPCLKWLGGKTQLLPVLTENLPPNWDRTKDRFIDLFFGGGAFSFSLAPNNLWINDINPELIGLYQVIMFHVEELITWLSDKALFANTLDNYLVVRTWDRDPLVCPQATMDEAPIVKAARTLYLNKTCFNGLYRLNQKGYFNAHYGFHDYDANYDFENLRAMSNFFREKIKGLTNYSFETWFELAMDDTIDHKGDLFYLDPPYAPLTATANFVSYTKEKFPATKHSILKDWMDKLTKMGCYVMQSNSNCSFIRELYRDYNVVEVAARRNVSRKGSSRAATKCEVLIRNY